MFGNRFGMIIRTGLFIEVPVDLSDDILKDARFAIGCRGLNAFDLSVGESRLVMLANQKARPGNKTYPVNELATGLYGSEIRGDVMIAASEGGKLVPLSVDELLALQNRIMEHHRKKEGPR